MSGAYIYIYIYVCMYICIPVPAPLHHPLHVKWRTLRNPRALVSYAIAVSNSKNDIIHVFALVRLFTFGKDLSQCVCLNLFVATMPEAVDGCACAFTQASQPYKGERGISLIHDSSKHAA
jgi:hypothetical protein